MISTELLNAFKAMNAEEDVDFQQHFVPTKYLSRLLNKDSDVIYGAKGSGKSGLRIALSILNKDKYFITNTFDLTSLSFSSFYSKTHDIHNIISQEEHLISSSIWKNTLLQFAMYSCIGKIPNKSLSDRIHKALTKTGFIIDSHRDTAQNINYEVLNTFERLFRRLSSFDSDSNQDSSQGIFHLSAEKESLVNQFPMEEDLSQILVDLKSELSSSNKTVLICIDGLDKIVNHTFDSRKAIFNGLIDAVYFFRFDDNLKSTFSIKAFLPHELTLETTNQIWDSDKHKHNTHYIQWNEDDLENFVYKRLSRYSRRGSTKFNEIWTDFFPEKITNNIYNVEENTFSYILRHTLFRPRQLQDHIFEILRDWIERTGGVDKIPSSFICKVISENNKTLAGDVAKHLSHNYPNIISFLLSWDNFNTNTTVHVLKDRIRKYLLTDDDFNADGINRIMDELYLFGIFGIDSKEEVQFMSKSKSFNFSFAGDFKLNLIHHSTSDKDLIAFSPMFREYCGLKRENNYIIIPQTNNKYA